MIDKVTGFNMSLLNTETILISVLDSLTQKPHPLTWNYTDFFDTKIHFKIKFEAPLNISRSQIETNRLDMLVVKLNDSSIF